MVVDKFTKSHNHIFLGGRKLTKPEINVKKLRVSDHAVQRIIERFNCKNEQEAINYVKSRFNNARYIGVTTCEQGHRSYMYCIGSIGIFVSMDLLHIKTVVNLESHGHYDGLKEKIEQMYLKEFRKADRSERSKNKRLEYIRLKNDAEIATLKYRAYKTRSHNVKNECESLIVKLQNEIRQCEYDIKNAESNKRKIARAIATVL